VRDWGLVSAFCRWKSGFPKPFLKKLSFFPMHILGSFAENQMAVVLWVCIRVFYSTLLVFMTVSVPVPC
jgi:hypothetical protein